MRKIFKKAVIHVLLTSLIITTGCSGSKLSKKADNATKEPAAKATNQSEHETKKGNEIYNELFNIDNFVSVSIDISDDELQKLQDDYTNYSNIYSKSPIYRKASKVIITINDDTYEFDDVGVRMKGNTSRSDFYSKEEGIFNLVHLKLKFDETFDDPEYYGEDAIVWDNNDKYEERKSRTFATLDGLDLKWNRGYDGTYIREYYAYAMFRDFGVLAPELSPAAVSVNKKNWGIFYLYEPVDKKFIQRHTDDKVAVGDLYKAAWTSYPASYRSTCTYGVNNEETTTFYNYDLKTNKKTSKHDSLANMINVLNAETVTKEIYESVVDSKYFADFAAVSYFCGSPDDMRNNYNNHYVYFSEETGKAIFIPYDYDTAVGNSSDWDPSFSAMTDLSPYSTKAVGNGSLQMNPVYKYALNEGSAYCLDEYKAALAEIADSKWMKYDNFLEIFNKVQDNYSKYVTPDINFKNVKPERLNFNIESDYSKGDNMAVKEYMEKILVTYKTSK